MNNHTQHTDGVPSSVLSAGKTVAVTGSTGLVGSHLVARLIKGGYRNIKLLARDAGSLPKLHRTLRREGMHDFEERFEIVEVALNNPVELAEALEGVHTVFHCAAVVNLGDADEETLVRTNVEITQHVVNASVRCGVERLVHVSSVAVIGNDADAIPNGDFPAVKPLAEMEAYAKSKYLSENEVRRGEVEGLDTVIVNPAVVLGAGDWESGNSTMVPVLAKGLPMYTDGGCSFVDVADVAEAMVALAESGSSAGKQYVLSGHDVPYRELIACANRIIGKKPPRFKAGRSLVSLAGFFGVIKLGDKGLGHYFFEENYYDGSKITRETGFEYTPLAQTLERLINQYGAERER